MLWATVSMKKRNCEVGCVFLPVSHRKDLATLTLLVSLLKSPGHVQCFTVSHALIFVSFGAIDIKPSG